jgi:cysteine-rich repeat protein
VGSTGGGNLRLYPGDGTSPLTSALNFAAGQTLANNGVFALAGNGTGTLAILATVTGSGTVHVVLDVTGYFASLCGDGVRSNAEQCDDGNTVNLDGCDSSCRFEQVLRINALTIQFGTGPTCNTNAFGGAFTGGAAQTQVQSAINNGIANGSISNLLQMDGLDDLTGTSDPALRVGIMNANPVSGIGYNGSNDLDWWYTVDPASIDATRKPTSSLAAMIMAKALIAGPGSASLALGAGAPPLALSSLRLSAQNGPTSTPLVSAGSTPGHLPSEHLDPLLSSFESSTSGTLCGNVSADGLAHTPMPSGLVGCGQFFCSQCYTASHSFLDVLVGGCTILGMTQISPTQPDQEDPAAAPAGAGPPYSLVPNGARFVTTCLDASSAAVPLAACLKDAAYSSYFTFGAGRVIPK